MRRNSRSAGRKAYGARQCYLIDPETQQIHSVNASLDETDLKNILECGELAAMEIGNDTMVWCTGDGDPVHTGRRVIVIGGEPIPGGRCLITGLPEPTTGHLAGTKLTEDQIREHMLWVAAHRIARCEYFSRH